MGNEDVDFGPMQTSPCSNAHRSLSCSFLNEYSGDDDVGDNDVHENEAHIVLDQEQGYL